MLIENSLFNSEFLQIADRKDFVLTNTDNLVVYRDNSQVTQSARKSCNNFPGGASMYQYFGGDSELVTLTLTTSYEVYLHVYYYG